MKLTGWTFDEIDEASAVRCDWLLQIDSTYAAAAEQARSNGSRR